MTNCNVTGNNISQPTCLHRRKPIKCSTGPEFKSRPRWSSTISPWLWLAQPAGIDKPYHSYGGACTYMIVWRWGLIHFGKQWPCYLLFTTFRLFNWQKKNMRRILEWMMTYLMIDHGQWYYHIFAGVWKLDSRAPCVTVCTLSIANIKFTNWFIISLLIYFCTFQVFYVFIRCP